MYAGVVSVIDHSKQILNVDFDDGDKVIGVPFNHELLINGQWQKQTDLEHVSLKDGKTWAILSHVEGLIWSLNQRSRRES